MRNLFFAFAATLLVFSSCSSNDPYAEKLSEFDTILAAMVSENEPGVAIIVTHENQIIFETYQGLAHVETQERLNRHHRMGIASMSKQFTGMAILMLLEEKCLSLDDEISSYLPHLPIGPRKITIRQLLSHISGLPELTRNETFMNRIDQPHTPDQIIDMAFMEDFTGDPGERFQYCNTGYTIAVALIEKLSGKNYASYLKEKILDPLRMTHTYACDVNQDASTAVQRYKTDSTGCTPARVMHFSNLIGGGGLISNARDLSRWGRALATGHKLPDYYRTIWESSKLNNGQELGYGLGMGHHAFAGRDYFYHPGQGDGMDAINMIFPDEKVSITVIQNSSPPRHSSREIALKAAELLFDPA